MFRQNHVPHGHSPRIQVVIDDRRGFSRSHLAGHQDDNQRLSTDADDVRRCAGARGGRTVESTTRLGGAATEHGERGDG